MVDPVASGIVPGLNRPGGNITGFASYEATFGGKWLELLSEIAPGLKRAAVMFNPDATPASAYAPGQIAEKLRGRSVRCSAHKLRWLPQASRRWSL
jgi:putative ABC transport system substrate-binding protein